MCSFPLVISWMRLFDMSFAEKCCDFLSSSALSAEPPQSWPQRREASFCWVFFFLLVFHCRECRKQVNCMSWPARHGVCRLDSGERKMKQEGRADNLRKAWDRAVSIPCNGSLPEGSPRQALSDKIYLYFGWWWWGRWTSSSCPQLGYQCPQVCFSCCEQLKDVWCSQLCQSSPSLFIRWFWRFTVPPRSSLRPFAVEAGSNSGSLGALHHCSQVACTLSLLNSILCLLDPNL